jgi:hypothetical protein
MTTAQGVFPKVDGDIYYACDVNTQSAWIYQLADTAIQSAFLNMSWKTYNSLFYDKYTSNQGYFGLTNTCTTTSFYNGINCVYENLACSQKCSYNYTNMACAFPGMNPTCCVITCFCPTNYHYYGFACATHTCGSQGGGSSTCIVHTYCLSSNCILINDYEKTTFYYCMISFANSNNGSACHYVYTQYQFFGNCCQCCAAAYGGGGGTTIAKCMKIDVCRICNACFNLYCNDVCVGGPYALADFCAVGCTWGNTGGATATCNCSYLCSWVCQYGPSNTIITGCLRGDSPSCLCNFCLNPRGVYFTMEGCIPYSGCVRYDLIDGNGCTRVCDGYFYQYSTLSPGTSCNFKANIKQCGTSVNHVSRIRCFGYYLFS